MTKTWLVDLFPGKITSLHCDVAVIVGTSVVNCGVSSKSLCYMVMICKEYHRSIVVGGLP